MMSPAEVSSNGIGALVAGNEFGHDSTGSGFGPRRRHAVQLDAATAGLSLHRSGRRAQANAAAAGLNFGRPANLAQIDAAAAGCAFTCPAQCCT